MVLLDVVDNMFCLCVHDRPIHCNGQGVIGARPSHHTWAAFRPKLGEHQGKMTGHERGCRSPTVCTRSLQEQVKFGWTSYSWASRTRSLGASRGFMGRSDGLDTVAGIR